MIIMTKKTVFCLILALLLLLSACGKKSENDPASETASENETASASEPGTGFYLSINEAYALGMLQNSLPENTPYTIETLDFTAPDTTTISGEVNLRLLAEQYKEQYNIPFAYTSFLPTGLPFSSSCRIQYSEEEGFTITPIGLEVTGYTIPTAILPVSLYNYYNGALNEYIRSLPVPITSVTMTDDAINITG